MKIQLNKSFFITVALLIATATLAHYSALWRMKGTTGGDDVAAEKKPLYWVAPRYLFREWFRLCGSWFLNL